MGDKKLNQHKYTKTKTNQNRNLSSHSDNLKQEWSVIVLSQVETTCDTR
jgi:hypothetical protein